MFGKNWLSAFCGDDDMRGIEESVSDFEIDRLIHGFYFV